jgi:hypothetical protein
MGSILDSQALSSLKNLPTNMTCTRALLPWRADGNLRFRSIFSRRRYGDGKKTTLSGNKNQVSAAAFLETAVVKSIQQQ